MPALTDITAEILTHRRAKIESQIILGDAQIRCPHCGGLNRNDGEYVHGRQFGDPLCCDAFTESLFQIITQVDEAQAAKYPGRVRQAADMIEVKNILYVESQIRSMKATGGGNILWCPYCTVNGRPVGNPIGNPELCCFDLGEAVAGVLAKMEIRRQLDQADRISDNADRLRECGVTVH